MKRLILLAAVVAVMVAVAAMSGPAFARFDNCVSNPQGRVCAGGTGGGGGGSGGGFGGNEIISSFAFRTLSGGSGSGGGGTGGGFGQRCDMVYGVIVSCVGGGS